MGNDPIVSGKEIVLLSVNRFKDLIRAEKILDALYAAGVDNWEGYSEAIEASEE